MPSFEALPPDAVLAAEAAWHSDGPVRRIAFAADGSAVLLGADGLETWVRLADGVRLPVGPGDWADARTPRDRRPKWLAGPIAASGVGADGASAWLTEAGLYLVRGAGYWRVDAPEDRRAAHLAVSPDGRFVAVALASTVWMADFVTRRTGPPAVVLGAAPAPPYRGTWLPAMERSGDPAVHLLLASVTATATDGETTVVAGTESWQVDGEVREVANGFLAWTDGRATRLDDVPRSPHLAVAGSCVVAAGADAVRLYDRSGGAPTASFGPLAGEITVAACSPGGTAVIGTTAALASASASGLRVYDTGQGGVVAAAFDGDRLRVAGADGTLLVLDPARLASPAP